MLKNAQKMWRSENWN